MNDLGYGTWEAETVTQKQDPFLTFAELHWTGFAKLAFYVSV